MAEVDEWPLVPAAVGGAGLGLGDICCVVFHTTEILSDPTAWVPNWQYPSQVVADPYRRKIIRTMDLSQSGKALENRPGGVETNRRGHVIQVELNMLSPDGTAARPELNEDEYRWVGEQVLAPIVRWIRKQGLKIDLTNVPPVTQWAGSAYVDAPQRFAYDFWVSFDGVCSHREVPENVHVDCGYLRLRKFAEYALGVLDGGSGGHSKTEDDDDMKIVTSDSGAVYLVGANSKREIVSADTWANTEWAIKQLLDSGIASEWIQSYTDRNGTKFNSVPQGALDRIPNG